VRSWGAALSPSVLRRASLLALGVLGALALVIVQLAGTSAARPSRRHVFVMPPIRHVFVIVLENESASKTFAKHSPAPYLANTLTREGAYLPDYHGIGHESNDNYIAMISGQAPNPQNQADCQFFDNLEPGTIGPHGQAIGQGCVFPRKVKTIADQLGSTGHSWRDYNESMGADSAREASVCAHPAINQRDMTQSATATDQYAARHNPFVYFHSIIDHTELCDTHVVNLKLLPRDLAHPARTPNYVFITPDLCSDGHDKPCTDPHRPGGYAGIERFLKRWVPRITHAPAFKQQDGLLIITFDEGSYPPDTSSCCQEIAGPNSPSPGITGQGGGDTGAVLLSPCIKPGTVSHHAYNHYTMLRSIEDIFKLPHLGYAQLPGERSFGADVFTRSCGHVPRKHKGGKHHHKRSSRRPKHSHGFTG
jgi:phosphatidylinositol-3-phosphatase